MCMLSIKVRDMDIFAIWLMFVLCTWIWSWVRSSVESYFCTRNDWALLVYILVIYLILKIEILICCFDKRMLHRFKWKIPHFSFSCFNFSLSYLTFSLSSFTFSLFSFTFSLSSFTFSLALTFDVNFSFEIVCYKMDESQTSLPISKSIHVHGRSLLKANRK